MTDMAAQFKIEAQKLEAEAAGLAPGSVEEVEWLSRAERRIVRHRLYEMIRREL